MYIYIHIYDEYKKKKKKAHQPNASQTQARYYRCHLMPQNLTEFVSQ